MVLNPPAVAVWVLIALPNLSVYETVSMTELLPFTLCTVSTVLGLRYDVVTVEGRPVDHGKATDVTLHNASAWFMLVTCPFPSVVDVGTPPAQL